MIPMLPKPNESFNKTGGARVTDSVSSALRHEPNQSLIQGMFANPARHIYMKNRIKGCKNKCLSSHWVKDDYHHHHRGTDFLI